MLHKMHFKVMMWLDSRDFKKKQTPGSERFRYC